MRKTFSIISLGCPRNIVDSGHLAAQFKRKGYFFKESAIGVDTLIINTCAFIDDARRESIDTVLKAIDAKKDGSVKRIVVAGCLPERYKSELKKELPEIDEFRGVLDFNPVIENNSAVRLTPLHYAYVKISEGCRNRCTYCIIPYLKGPYKTRTIKSIIKEAVRLIQQGVKELILVGQDTSLYGIDLYGEKKLAVLLKKLSSVSDNIWIRLLYCHPANLEKEVISVIADSNNICKYIDLPVEHISDKILRRMGRRIKKKEIISLIRYIRMVMPGAALRTSIIVGFPGETEKEFRELLAFIEDVRFERLGLFTYSREEGTPAYRYEAQISERQKEDRFNQIMHLQQGISEEINKKFKGKALKVLIDEKENDTYLGRTEYDAPEVDGIVYVRDKGLKVGDFYKVRIIDTYEYDLVGEVFHESCK